LGAVAPAQQMVGYDVDPEAFVHLARTLPSQSTENFYLKDFLRSCPTNHEPMTTVLGNPPFVSYHRMDSDQRAILDTWRNENVPLFPKSASLWAYFLVHSLAFLAPQGRLAFILPTAFCTADYSKPILNHLANVFARVVVFKMRDQLFLHAGARERTVVLLAEGFRPDQNAAPAKTETYAVCTLGELSRAIQHVAKPSSPSVVCPEFATDLLSETANGAELFSTIGEFASVSIGEVVGDTEFFVKQADVWEDLGIPFRFLHPLVTKGKQLSGVTLRARDVNGRYAAVPLLLRAEGKRFPKALVRYLDSYPARARAGNRTFQKRDPWHLTSYRSDAAAFIGSLSKIAPRVVLNQAKISCANGLYQLRPLPGVRWSPAIAAASLSTVCQLAAEQMARSRGPGALKLEPSDVKRLLIPKTALEMPISEARRLASDVDRIYRQHGFAAAARHADYALLLEPQSITHRQLTTLQDALRYLRSLRVPKA